MVNRRELAAGTTPLLLHASGNIGVKNLFWDNNVRQILLHDPEGGDLLQSHLDLEFIFKDCLVTGSSFRAYGDEVIGHPYTLVRHMVADYLDQFLHTNPYAVVSALVAGLARTQSQQEYFAVPEYGMFAIQGWTPVRMATAFQYLQPLGDTRRARWNRNDGNLVLGGHLEYLTDLLETSSETWGVRVTGVVTMRFKTGVKGVGVPIFSCASRTNELPNRTVIEYDAEQRGLPVSWGSLDLQPEDLFDTASPEPADPPNITAVYSAYLGSAQDEVFHFLIGAGRNSGNVALAAKTTLDAAMAAELFTLKTGGKVSLARKYKIQAINFFLDDPHVHFAWSPDSAEAYNAAYEAEVGEVTVVSSDRDHPLFTLINDTASATVAAYRAKLVAWFPQSLVYEEGKFGFAF
jgi:hypothetical protein